jgi:hypothetical protein
MLAVAAHADKIAHPSTVLGMSGSGWAELAQVMLVFVATFAILPTLWGLLRQRKTERERQVFDSYNQMAEKWSEFLALCLQYPDLGIAPLALKKHTDMPPSRLLLYSALIQLLNRAYVTYADAPAKIREDRYIGGWEKYLEELLRQDEFREAWDLLGYYYDQEFVEYVKKLIENSEQNPQVGVA